MKSGDILYRPRHQLLRNYITPHVPLCSAWDTTANKSQPPVDVPGAVADDFREGRMVVHALPSEKGASPREESKQWGCRGGGGGEGTKGGIAGRGVGTKRERRLAILRRRRGTTGGRWILQPGEIVDDENRRRRLVVSRSLTRVGLFFNLGTRRVGELFGCEGGDSSLSLSSCS